MLSYVLPTHNRPEQLQQTLEALGTLDAHAHECLGGGEVIIIDNASSPPVAIAPATLPNGLPRRIIRLEENLGAAARNEGVRAANSSDNNWLVMLDDDSHPLDAGFIELLAEAPADIAALGAEIFLPDGSRERGGLPEVIVGCGAAIRREAFLAVGGYDAAFEFYAEEYDLCAKLIHANWRIAHDSTGRFRVLHEKTSVGRNFNEIVRRLVRNNAWVMQRYAPENLRQAEIMRTIERYARIAMNEHAAGGFALGMNDLASTFASQPRREMNAQQWDRFTGASAARSSLSSIVVGSRVAIVEDGKNIEVIRRALADARATIVNDLADADEVVVGTLSPGPMRDAWQRSGGRARMCG